MTTVDMKDVSNCRHKSRLTFNIYLQYTLRFNHKKTQILLYRNKIRV